MNKISAFLQAHKVSSHTIAVVVLGFFGLYTQDKQFADYVNGLLAHWPKIAAGLTTASLIYLRYSSSQKVVGGGK